MKKITSYIFILITIFGLFSPLTSVNAQQTEKEFCFDQGGAIYNVGISKNQCLSNVGYNWGTVAQYSKSSTPAPQSAATQSPPGTTSIKQAVDDQTCASITSLSFSLMGCIVTGAYYILYALPAMLLGVIAKLFNALLALTLSSALYNASGFISEAWKVVRDLSNVFFIIILLYTAIQLILDVHGADAKRTIGLVVVMAMLINFSMFFTKVVIDSSNILALVFYNQIGVEREGKAPAFQASTSKDSTGVQEKPISEAIVSGFNPARTMDPSIFTKTVNVNGVPTQVNNEPSILLGLIVISGAIFLFAAYAFFIAGFAFIGRMIELWLLIIFSPFAFMSFALPKLSHVEYIGWGSWHKKLVDTAFMAPIFMFFMYLIAKITEVDYITKLFSTNQNFLGTLLLLIIPAMISLILLMKATEFAKKGSGQLGDAMIGLGKAAVGLAVGGAAVGVAAAGRGTVGAFVRGASTGDTAARRLAEERRTGIKDTSLGRFARIKGGLQTITGIDKLQVKYATKINDSQQKMAHAAHARQKLEKESQAEFHTSYSNLSGPERIQLNQLLDRNHEAEKKFGKSYKQLKDTERATVDANIAAGTTVAIRDNHGLTEAQHLLQESRVKQGIRGSILQSARTGTFDPRNLAELVIGEQDKTLNKVVTGLTGAVAKSLRAGFKTAGVDYGMKKAEGKFLKDLGMTITESLKSAKIKVDLSHVADEHKEDHSGGHGGGGHH